MLKGDTKPREHVRNMLLDNINTTNKSGSEHVLENPASLQADMVPSTEEHMDLMFIEPAQELVVKVVARNTKCGEDVVSLNLNNTTTGIMNHLLNLGAMTGADQDGGR
jgi:hypothetical protein